MRPLPNRLALYLGAAAALLAGLAPLVLDTDWESTAGILAFIGALTALVDRFLRGWQIYENNPAAGYPELTGPEDDFDEAKAEPIPPAVGQAARARVSEEPPRG